MKGITHFISGVTVASFCPWAVEAAQNGNPVYFILGAIAGILPDTIDFKFYRFFYKYDVRVELKPDQLDPQPIADAVAQAVERAAEGRRTTFKLASIKLGADDWRQYRVNIDAAAGEVRVQFGPIVSTGQVPQPDSLPDPRPVATAPLAAPVLQNYESTYTVDIFDGPGFAFECNDRGQIEIDFLPWHRNRSHSLIVAALLGGIAAVWRWQAGVVVAGAYLIHVLEDQMGHMGSNLFFPFSKKRIPGLKWMRSGDAAFNFTGVWLCCLLIFWNLYAGIEAPVYRFSFLQLMMTAMVLPFAVFVAVRWLILLPGRGDPEPVSTAWDL